jgi:hypothetical protein
MKLFAATLLAAAPVHADPAKQVDWNGYLDIEAMTSFRQIHWCQKPHAKCPKLEAPDYELTGERRVVLDAWAEHRAAQAQIARSHGSTRTKHKREAATAYQKLIAAAVVVVRADPGLRPRLLLNGRPACGNAQIKAEPPEYCDYQEPR